MSGESTRRTAIVTGAARGIGAAISARLAEDGCDVAVIDLEASSCGETVAAVTAAGGRGLPIGADVTDEAAVSSAVQRVVDELGPPTILVNNAGVMRDHILHRMTLEEWETVIAVHLRGAFLMTRACQPHFRAAMWGRIVNLSSTGALGYAGAANYATAKAGLQGFTRTLALELGRYNVTVNAVAPGFTITDMTRATAERTRQDFDAMVERVVTDIPVGRAGEPQDIAHAVAFFADERSGFVSGQVLYVAGGPQG